MTYRPHAFPVSVKGVAVQPGPNGNPDGKVLLLRNERDEWELPGGKLELGEDPPERLLREIEEECGWTAKIGPILDAWQYHIRAGIDVLIVTYGAHVTTDAAPVVSHEHKEVGLFAEHEVEDLRMPAGYKRSIADWYTRLRESAGQPAGTG